jgi:elongation factor P
MIDVNDLRKGVTFEMDGGLYKVLDYHHHKPGRGNAVIRTKLRNIRTGATIERTFQSGDRVQDIRIENRPVQYLYHDGDLYHFMDTETFDQLALSSDMLGDAVSFLKDSMELTLAVYGGEPIDVELPTTVDLEVTETEPGIKGDRATGPTKAATTETGYKVQVPLFVNPGDVIRVDTRTGGYLTRV